MDWQSLSLIVPSLIIIAVSVAISLYVWRHPVAPGLSMFPLISLAVTLWLIGHTVYMLTADGQARLFWANLETLGYDILPVAWLSFLLLFSRVRNRISPRLTALLLVVPVVSQGLVWYFGAPNIYPRAAWLLYRSNLVLLPAFNGWDWLHLTYSFALILLGVFVLFQSLARSPRQYQGQVAILVLGALIPGLVFVSESGGIRPIPYLELTPLAFTISQFAFFWAIYRYRLMDFVPVARDILVEKMIDGVLVLDRYNRIVDINPAAEKICQMASSQQPEEMLGEVIGRPISELMPACSHIFRADGMGDHTVLTQAEITIEGCPETRLYDMRISPLVDSHGHLLGRLVIIHEITERKRVEAEREKLGTQLADQARLMDAILATTPDHFHLHDRDGRYLYVSPQALRSMNLESADVIGKTWREIGLPPAVGRSFDARLQKVFQTGQSNTEEMLLPTADGVRYFEQILSPFRDAQGNVISVVSTMRDISERKTASQKLQNSLTLLQATVESTADGVIAVDNAGNLVVANKKIEKLLNLPPGWQENTPPEEQLKLMVEQMREPETFARRLDELSKQPDGTGYDILEMKDGRIIEVYVSPYFVGGEFAGRVWNLRDVTERKRAEEALHLANERLSQTVSELEHHNREVNLLSEMGNMLQSCATVEEAYSVVADFARQLFPHQSGGLYVLNHSRTLAEALVTWGAFPPDELVFAPGDCWALRRGRPHIVRRDPQGHITGLSCQHLGEAATRMKMPYVCAPLLAQGEAIGIFHLQGESIAEQGNWEDMAVTVAENIAMLLSNLALRERLRMQSIRDPLTGLFNRRYMEEALERELRRATRHGYPVGILMVDIDHFKHYNDRYGHGSGDALLQAVGTFLRENLRGEDVACRYGGEEFTIILPDATPEDACRMAERLWKGVRQMQLEHLGQQLGMVTVSVGVASYPKDAQTGEALLNAADDALYRAKDEGRDRIVVY